LSLPDALPIYPELGVGGGPDRLQQLEIVRATELDLEDRILGCLGNLESDHFRCVDADREGRLRCSGGVETPVAAARQTGTLGDDDVQRRTDRETRCAIGTAGTQHGTPDCPPA